MFSHRIINTLISLLQPAGQSSVMRYKRFVEDFGDGDAPPPAPGKVPRPADFLATFAGNTDDAFRIGLQVCVVVGWGASGSESRLPLGCSDFMIMSMSAEIRANMAMGHQV